MSILALALLTAAAATKPFSSDGACSAGQLGCQPGLDAEEPVNMLQTHVKKSQDTSGEMKCHVFYWNADHNLDEDMSKDIAEVIGNKAAMSHPLYYPIGYIDRVDLSHEQASKIAIDGLKASNGKDDAPRSSSARYLEKDFETNNMKVVQDLGEQNSDNQETMTNFLTWAFKRCKAKSPDAKVLLTFSSHGGGWAGFGGDEFKKALLERGQATAAALSDVNRQALIRNNQIRKAILDSKAAANIPEKLSLLSFDACNMMTYSALYVLHDVAELYMASEAEEPGHGWDFASLNPSLSPFGMTKEIVRGFAQGLHGKKKHRNPKTLLAIHTQDFVPFKVAMDAVATAMETSIMTGPDSANIAKSIMAARDRTLWTDESSEAACVNKKGIEGTIPDPDAPGMSCFYVNVGDKKDIGDFLEALQLQNIPSLRDSLAAAKAKYNEMIDRGNFRKGPGTNPRLTGMAIWFPDIRGNYGLEAQDVMDWKHGENGFKAAGNRPWHKFLKTLSNYMDDAPCPSIVDSTVYYRILEAAETCQCSEGKKWLAKTLRYKLPIAFCEPEWSWNDDGPSYRGVLVKLGGTCGTRGKALSSNVEGEADCAALASGEGFQAFSLGKGFQRGKCYGEMLKVDEALKAKWDADRANAPCPEKGGWKEDKTTDFYYLEEEDTLFQMNKHLHDKL